MLLSNRRQLLALCTECQEFYMAMLLSFEVALMSVPSCVEINKYWKRQQSILLFYSYSPEYRKHFEKHTILVYLDHLSNTMTTNDYKWAKIVFYLSRDAFLFMTLILDQIAILSKFSRRSLENFTRSRKNRTVTFNCCILGIYGSYILPHAFPSRWFSPTFACPWRAANDLLFIS